MKILVTESLATAGLQLMRQRHEVTLRVGMPRHELLAQVRDADALVIRSATMVDEELIAAARRLRVVGRAGIGIDNVNVQAATARGVLVCNAPSSNVLSAAEHTVALMLAAARHIPQADSSLRAGRWERSRFAGTELSGKTLGVIGLGRVGTLVVQRCKALGMRAVAYDPYLTDEAAERAGVSLHELDAVLKRSDVITVHLPKTEQTTGLIGARELSLMKRTALLVNTSRGGIVNEVALHKALSNGVIGGAGLDVFELEPPGAHPLFELPNVVATPHLGASTEEAQDRASVMIAEAVSRALEGEIPPGAVNAPYSGEIAEQDRGYLQLARRLGRVLTAVRGGVPAELIVECVGRTGRGSLPKALTAGALIGLLSDVTAEDVTFVNAGVAAARRGVSVSTLTTAATDQHQGLLRLRCGEDTVAGTLTGPAHRERLTELYGFALDVEPSEHMLFVRYRDRPGVVGQIGTLLGEAGVNIAAMQVARGAAGEEAVMVLAVDSKVPAQVLESSATRISALEMKTISASRFNTPASV